MKVKELLVALSNCNPEAEIGWDESARYLELIIGPDEDESVKIDKPEWLE